MINQPQAEQVRALFGLHDELGCLRDLLLAAAERGYRSKQQTFATGTGRGGGVLSLGQIHYLLTNKTYCG